MPESLPIEPVRPNTGGGLTPEETVGRDALVAVLFDRLIDGSVRIEDPRRMGKTSTLKLLASMGTDEAPVVYLTVQGHRTVDEVVLEIARALHSHLGNLKQFAGVWAGFFDKATLNAGLVKFEASLARVSAIGKLEQLLEALSQRFPDGRMVIAIDELPWAVSNIATGTDPETQGPAVAGAFLQALQRMRDKYPAIRWILAGSIGFHHVLRLAGQTNAVLTGLEPVSCGPLEDEYSDVLVRRLFAGTDIAAVNDAVVREVTTTSGAIPFIAHHLVELLSRRTTRTVTDVEAVFDEFIHERSRSAELTHLLQRLDIYMGEADAALAERILDQTSDAGSHSFDSFLDSVGDGDRESLLKVLNWLVDDHYLVESSTGFVWRYDVLRKVWAARRRL